MTTSVARALLLASLCVWSCGESQPPKVEVNSQTHWLQACEVDADCGALSCVCQVCTASCTTRDECGGLSEGAYCAPASSATAQSQCGAAPQPPPALCLDACVGPGCVELNGDETPSDPHNNLGDDDNSDDEDDDDDNNDDNNDDNDDDNDDDSPNNNDDSPNNNDSPNNSGGRNNDDGEDDRDAGLDDGDGANNSGANNSGDDDDEPDDEPDDEDEPDGGLED